MSEQLPWEDEFTADQWLEFEPRMLHTAWVDQSGVYWANIGCGSGYQAFGATRDEAIVGAVKQWCRQREVPLPFRPRPDLRTVESCIRAITDAGGDIRLNSGRVFAGAKYVLAWKPGDTMAAAFGETNVPWALEAVQAAARYVLGIPEPEEEEVL